MVGWAVGGASQDCGAPQGARTACPSTSEEGSAPRAPASGSPRPRGSGGADLEGGDWLVQHATSSKVPMRVPRIPRQTRVPRRRSKEPPSRRGSRGSPSSRTSQGRGEQRRAPRDGVTSPGSRWQAGDEAGRGKAAGPCASVAIATPSGLQGDRTVLGLPAPRTHAPHAPHPRAPHLHTSHPRAPHPTPPRTHAQLRCTRPRSQTWPPVSPAPRLPRWQIHPPLGGAVLCFPTRWCRHRAPSKLSCGGFEL